MRLNVLQMLAYASLATSGLIMPLYAVQVGATIDYIGWIGAAFGLASFASSIVFGRLGDQEDRKRILQFGFLLCAGAFAAQLFAKTPETFLLARFAAGFAVGIVPPSLAAYAYDKRRPLGKFTSFNAFGWLIASLLVVGVGALAVRGSGADPVGALARLVARLGPYETLFLLSAILCVVAVFTTLGMPSMHRGLRVPLFPRAILANNAHVYLSIFLRHLGAAAIWTIYPLYIIRLGGDLALVGWVHIINMVAQILVLRNVERLRRVGRASWLIGIGLVTSAITFWSFTLVQTATQLLPLQVLLGVSFACLWLGSLKEVMEHNVERATATGLLNASMNLSNVAGPLLGGVVAAAFGFEAIMDVAAVLTLAAFGLYLVMARKRLARQRVLPAETAGPAADVAP